MANWEWPSIEDKLESIGYLAVPGVVSAIEATVPRGRTEQFPKEYENKFSGEYPYEADKYGKQFRIYLNDTEGCPEFLKENLDGAYGNRINNTQFIDELVKEFGFKFKKGIQDSNMIRNIVFSKYSRPLFDSFDKGYYGYRDFIQNIEKYIKSNNNLSKPNMLNYDERNISRNSGHKADNKNEKSTGFTPNQMLKMGMDWRGICSILVRTKR